MRFVLRVFRIFICMVNEIRSKEGSSDPFVKE